MITLEQIKQQFKEYEEDGYISGQYSNIYELFGTVVVEEHEPSYQGSSWILFTKDNKFGYLKFGWGSCSGCDALQACSNLDEVVQLANGLESDILWGTKEEILQYLKTHDWEGDWDFHNEERIKFVEQAIAYLEKI